MNRDEVRDRLYRLEGKSAYMYQCTGGEVTVGVGHAIFSPEDAGALVWSVGTPQKAAADWANVKAAQPDKVASFYATFSTCRIGDDEIAKLCDSDIASYEAQLKKSLPKWDSYPELAQQALFDMGYNLGVAGLMKFKNMLAAVDRADGEEAAKQSHRKGIQESRNQEIYDLFFDAWG